MRDRIRLQQPKPGTAPEPESPSAEVHRLQDLQRRVGNAAVVNMVGAQAKLTVGAVNDPAEREADRVAAEVMRKLDGSSAAEVDPAEGGVARQVRRKATAAPVGPEGGDVVDDVAAQIDGSRGGGSPLDGDVRRTMEDAFGADFADVRVHAGGKADTLSSALGARAFTTGNDIFFANGEYDPASRGGRETLAHELTHTVQQTGGAARKIRRLTLQNTNWEAADSGFVASGGTGGVAIVRDGTGTPVVVKAGESLSAEAIVAANMLNDGLNEGDEDGWKLASPKARIADKAESDRIKAAVPKALGDRATDPAAQKFLGKLGQPHTIVFDYAAGTDFGKILAEQAGTKKKKRGKGQELDKKTTVGQFFTNPGQLTMLGKGAGFDVFLGNGDRLVSMFGPQNWMVDAKSKTINLVDNGNNDRPNFFTANDGWGTSAEDGFNAWMEKYWAKNFAAGDDASIADYALNRMGDEIVNGHFAKASDAAVMKATFAKQRAKMTQWFITGLQQSRTKMLASLGDPLKLIQGVPAELQEETLTSVIARKYVLLGDGANAWARARTEALRLLAPMQAPEEEEEKPKAKWARGERPRSWQSATPTKV